MKVVAIDVARSGALEDGWRYAGPFAIAQRQTRQKAIVDAYWKRDTVAVALRLRTNFGSGLNHPDQRLPHLGVLMRKAQTVTVNRSRGLDFMQPKG